MTQDEKELSRFDSKDINQTQSMLIAGLRLSFKQLANDILTAAPASADRSAAMRYLRLAHMQVNAAICHDWPEEKNENI